MLNPSTQKQLDSAPKTKSGAIDLTKAERIAEGGTHILYRFPHAPYIIKLMKQNPNPQELEQLEQKYALLYACFERDGKQRCIREQHIALSVLAPDMDEAQETALSIVPFEACFHSKVKFDFKIEPTELDPYLMEQHQDLLRKANIALLQEHHPETSFNLNDYALLDERIGAILQRLDEDPCLRPVMAEFLEHYRDFYQRTNIILDAMGFENILFFKDEDNHWQFKIGSAIKHDTGKYTQELFDNLSAGKEVETNFVNFTHTYFSPANIRAVNACALKLGLKRVIDDVSIDAKELFQVAQKISVGEQMWAYAKHGDFKKVEQLLQEHEGSLSFNLVDFWAYSRIADEYIKHGMPASALQIFLNKASQLPVILPPEPSRKDDAIQHAQQVKQIEEAKAAILDRKNAHDIKIKMHEKLNTHPMLAHKKQLQQTKAATANVESPAQITLLSTIPKLLG